MSPQKGNMVWSGPIQIDWLTVGVVLAMVGLCTFAFSLPAGTVIAYLGISFLGLIPLEVIANSRVVRIRLLIYLCDEYGYEQGYSMWQIFRGFYVAVELMFVSYIFSNNLHIGDFPPILLVSMGLLVVGQILARIVILWAKFQRYALLDIYFNLIGDSNHGVLYVVDVWETYGFIEVRGPWHVDKTYARIRYRTSFQPNLVARKVAPYCVLYLNK